MEPTLQVKDRVLVVKNTFLETDISTGDIIVFYSPQTQFDENYYDQFIESLQIWKLTQDQTYLNTALIKRVVGTSGDEVVINQSGEVFVNNNRFFVTFENGQYGVNNGRQESIGTCEIDYPRVNANTHSANNFSGVTRNNARFDAFMSSEEIIEVIAEGLDADVVSDILVLYHNMDDNYKNKVPFDKYFKIYSRSKYGEDLNFKK